MQKGMGFEKALSRLSTSSVALVLLVKAETQGRLLQCFENTGDLTHTQMHTRRNSPEQPRVEGPGVFSAHYSGAARLVKNSSEGIQSQSLRSPVCCSAD